MLPRLASGEQLLKIGAIIAINLAMQPCDLSIGLGQRPKGKPGRQQFRIGNRRNKARRQIGKQPVARGIGRGRNGVGKGLCTRSPVAR